MYVDKKRKVGDEGSGDWVGGKGTHDSLEAGAE